MKRFLLLYTGPPTPPEGVRPHEGWPEWFDKLGEGLVDLGSPMANGFVLHGDGSTSDEASSLNGYTIVQAEDRSQALDLVRDHPLLALGGEYAIEVFEVPKR
jgi:YCII-related domain